MDRQKIKRELNQFVEKTVRTIRPDRIILYGSFARGNAITWSDIDIAVISPKKTQRKIEDIADSIGSQFIFDIRNYKREEFEKISPLSIYNEIKKEGLILYSKN